MSDDTREAVAKFNESAASATRALRAPNRGRGPGEFLELLSPFRSYSVSISGQMTLPAPARNAWSLKGGGQVQAAFFGRFVLIVQDGVWREVLHSWQMDDALRASLQHEIDQAR